ncbi:MAG: CehA/McbA family metallohydrolase, partial [Chitinispirillaceae bacterium]|nr:CehA/McbA family metallohydrolase [Chitinispirillaceae bacterium]
MKNTFTTTLALMKNIRWHPLLLLFLTCNYTLVPLIPQKKPRIHVKLGNNYVYFGDLHNHTELSDGSGTPRMAYDYTRYNAGLDFFAITDHDFVTSDNQMTHEKWQLIKATADSCNHDSEFVALWGFEWTSWTYNHCSVIGTDDFCSCDDTATNTFTKFCNWLSRREAYAFFNHPGRVGPPLESNLYASEPIEQFVGMELWNKSQRFDYYYYNDGLIPNDNNKSYYDEALSRGWRIGASGAGDNHWATWGTAVDCRMGILAPALTRKDILGALEARRFFSTLDKNIALSFTADSLEMGSIVHGRKHTFRVHALDGDKEPFSKVMLFNSNHDTIATWNPDPGPVSITFEDTVISDGYYYVKVSQPDGDEAISSPIWYFCSGTFNKGTSPDTPPTPDLPQIPDHTPKPCSTVVQPEFTSGYNYYFGNFHNHTNLSDGMGTPQEAYDYARYTAHLDFFGLSDHCYALNDDKWRITKATADSCNEDSSYVTLWGFEWTSSLYGHCSVVGSEDYCTVSDTATDSFTELLDWLATREGYAFFNHPGSRVFSDSLFNRFSGPPSDKFVGLDLWNK